MEAVLGKGADVLFNYGVIGVFLIASVFANWRLWGALQAVQDRRIEEARELIKVAEANSTAIETLTDLMKEFIREYRDGRGGRR